MFYQQLQLFVPQTLLLFKVFFFLLLFPQHFLSAYPFDFFLTSFFSSLFHPLAILLYITSLNFCPFPLLAFHTSPKFLIFCLTSRVPLLPHCFICLPLGLSEEESSSFSLLASVKGSTHGRSVNCNWCSCQRYFKWST